MISIGVIGVYGGYLPGSKRTAVYLVREPGSDGKWKGL